MHRRIKLIWDFRGMDAREIAVHHEIHLKEFADNKKVTLLKSGVEEIAAGYWIAYMVVDETNMLYFRDTLRPHRGEVAEN